VIGGNLTESNCCYDSAEGTVRWFRVLRERVTVVNWTESNFCYDITDGRVRWCSVLRERVTGVN
jgi:hypothetical protein